jgi:predicted PurR-regulated permease PerM
MSETTNENTNTSSGKKFERSVWKVCGIVALIIAVLWILKETFNVLLLVLAGALIAVYFHGVSKWINRKTHLSRRSSMAISVAVTVLIIAGVLYFSGARIQAQIAELTKTLPATIENVKEDLNRSYIGQKILEGFSQNDDAEKTSAFLQTFFRSTFGILGDLYIVIFIGIFFTISPSLYINGFLQLFPVKAKEDTKRILHRLGHTLTRWLEVKIFSMFEVTVFSFIGLSILNVPMAFALAIIAGLLNFVPNLGPLIAMIPAVLVGLMQGINTALIIAALYTGIQILDGSIIVPALQQKLMRIPPAILIIAQLLMGILSGGWGVLLASPLLIIIMIVVDETYLKKNKKQA